MVDSLLLHSQLVLLLPPLRREEWVSAPPWHLRRLGASRLQTLVPLQQRQCRHKAVGAAVVLARLLGMPTSPLQDHPQNLAAKSALRTSSRCWERMGPHSRDPYQLAQASRHRCQQQRLPEVALGAHQQLEEAWEPPLSALVGLDSLQEALLLEAADLAASVPLGSQAVLDLDPFGSNNSSPNHSQCRPRRCSHSKRLGGQPQEWRLIAALWLGRLDQAWEASGAPVPLALQQQLQAALVRLPVVQHLLLEVHSHSLIRWRRSRRYRRHLHLELPRPLLHGDRHPMLRQRLPHEHLGLQHQIAIGWRSSTRSFSQVLQRRLAVASQRRHPGQPSEPLLPRAGLQLPQPLAQGLESGSHLLLAPTFRRLGRYGLAKSLWVVSSERPLNV